MRILHIRFFLFLCFFHSLSLAVAQTATAPTIQVSGYISDQKSGERLIGANIYDIISKSGVATNTYGFFSILVEENASLEISYAGYQTQKLNIVAQLDTFVEVQLQPTSIELATVEVSAKAIEEEASPQMSTHTISLSEVKKLPNILGEVDLIRVLQLLPGVQASSTGLGGLYVRGGNESHNLTLLDGIPVYNSSHLFGLFSVFNSDAIKQTELMKGVYPARYGGRLASVLNINMKEGNDKTFHGEGSIGMISSKVTLEGPIKKEKASYLVSARYNTIGLLLNPITKAVSNGNTTAKYNFYDITAKTNYQLSQKDRIYLSFYTGFDFLDTDGKSEGFKNSARTLSKYRYQLDWGNTSIAMRWNHLWSGKLFSNLTTYYTSYKYNLTYLQSYEETQGGSVTYSDLTDATYFAGIEDISLRLNFDYAPARNVFLRFGAYATLHVFDTGVLDVFQTEEERVLQDARIESDNFKTGEFNVFAEADFSLGDRFRTNVGLHYSSMLVRNTYYHFPEPRINLRYLMDNNWSLKASAGSMVQYLSLLTGNGIGIPTDLWVPSTPRIRPQQSRQVALGIAKGWNQQRYTAELEVYFKDMKNLTSFDQGESFLAQGRWQDKIVQGVGQSYGTELLLKKTKGATTGWISYTLAWTDRQFEEINRGQRFYYKYDRRHDFSLVVAHQFSERWEASMVWTYGSGHRTTLPVNTFGVQIPLGFGEEDPRSITVDAPDRINNIQLPAYHRLDLSMSFIKKKKKWTRRLSVGIYNVYNRQNPSFLFLVRENNRPRYRQVSLLPILPSFSYSFKF